MSDEEKAKSPETGAPAAPVLGDAVEVRKAKHWPIVISAIAVCAIAMLVAFLHWHEEPSFCNAFCHQPMDRYVEGYYSGDLTQEAAVHEQNGVTCLGCHWPQAKMMDLVHEVVMWTTDGFTDPLEDQTTFASDEFCGKCHDGVTAPTKESATADWPYNPHNIPQDVAMHQTSGADGGAIQCSDCHKAHKASVLQCAECHADYFNEENGTVPTGWTLPADAKAKVSEAYGVFDPHNYPTDVPMHMTAGSDGGPIACSDCHKPAGEQSVMVCAQCHANSFTEENGLVPAGWKVPDGAIDVFSMMASSDESSSDEADSSGSADVSSVADGTYTGSAQGMESTIEVTVTVAGGKITDLQATGQETEGIGSTALEQLPSAIVEAGTTDGVDVVSGASVTSKAIIDATNSALSGGSSDGASASSSADKGSSSSTTYKDGEYTGSAKGMESTIEVTVTVKDGKISDVKATGEETQGIGTKALEQLPSKIVEANGTDGVDAVSGASVTSKAIISAVEDALSGAAA